MQTPNRTVWVSSPTCRCDAATARISVTLRMEQGNRTLWFATAAEYASCLESDRSDGFLIALLSWAMHHGYDLTFEAPLSQRLYFSVTHFLIPVLLTIRPHAKPIRIVAPLTSEPCVNKGGVGTGLSCGIDSLATVDEYFLNPRDLCQPYRLTHAAFFNVGSNGHSAKRDPAVIDQIYASRLETAKACATALGLPLVPLDSNIMEYIDFLPFAHVVTLCNAAAVLLLQRLFAVYYVSSSVSALDAKIAPVIEYGDAFILPMLSTEALSLYSAGMTLTRIEKTRRVATIPQSYRYLNVCIKEAQNCSRCNKCIRTIISLDVLGHLQAYTAAFDLSYYNRNKGRLWARLRARIPHEDDAPLLREIFDIRAKRRFGLPVSFWPWVAIFQVGSTLKHFFRRAFRRG
jgi:hypothetical protein